MRTPTMLTTDLSLRFDPDYGPISKRFHENPDELADAFARAWFKLTHRDMGPIERYLGPEVPSEELLWQDPVPKVTHELIGAEDIAALKTQILDAGPSVSELVKAAWASASTFRGSDKRGGANGARIRLEPQNGWEVNDPAELATVLARSRASSSPSTAPRTAAANRSRSPTSSCSRAARPSSRRPRTAASTSRSRSRRDARTRRQEQTDADSFAPLEPAADGFRNYLAADHRLTAEYLLVDKANLLTLSAPEMTVLVGGLRVLGANSGGSTAGVLTDRPGTLTNDFFVNLLDLGTTWMATAGDAGTFVGRDATTRSRGPAPASTSCSARTPSCARLPRSTPATTRARSSCTTSSPRGSRS